MGQAFFGEAALQIVGEMGTGKLKMKGPEVTFGALLGLFV